MVRWGRVEERRESGREWMLGCGGIRDVRLICIEAKYFLEHSIDS